MEKQEIDGEVLLVDDEPLLLHMLRGLFEQRGMTVSTATSSRQAIQLLQNATFDLVITDMRMETRTSGIDVIRAAKAMRPAPAAFLLSAYPMQPAEWRSCGADGMFTKGNGINRMLIDLERKMAQRRLRRVAAHNAKRAG